MINYVLENNHLTTDKPNERLARVINVRSFTEIDLAEAISKRNLGISKPEALAMLEAASEIQLEWISSGNAVNLRLAHFHFGIPGTFKEGEHPVEAAVRVTPSKEVVEAARKNILRHAIPTVRLYIDYVEDVKSGTINSFITRGGNVKIFGYNLKIVGTNPDVRVEFISLEDPEAIYPVPAEDLVINNPSELLIVAPHMVVDEPVQLKITTQYSGNASRPLKDPRSTVFDKGFTVKG